MEVHLLMVQKYNLDIDIENNYSGLIIFITMMVEDVGKPWKSNHTIRGWSNMDDPM